MCTKFRCCCTSDSQCMQPKEVKPVLHVVSSVPDDNLHLSVYVFSEVNLNGEVNDGYDDFVNGSREIEIPAPSERTPVKT